ncbi:MAG: ABC transporter substrate-binding protein [Actinomycetota bacterium]|nr:ABC transporter substrate-binding protein [Actinomycetota bacterium]
MKKILVIVLMLAMVLVTASLLGCQNEDGQEEEVVSIGIIQIVEHPALDAARDGFIDALKDAGYEDGKNVSLDIQNAQGDTNNLSTISDRFVSNKVDLVLAIATPSAQSIAGKTTEIPILGTAITDYVAAGLVASNEEPGGNISGTTDMNPVKEQIELLVKLVPDAKTVGTMYNSSEINSVIQAEMAKEAAEALGLEYTEVTVSTSNDVQQAAQALVQKCDAIYLPTDNIMASSMPLIHDIAVTSKTPVICGEENMALSGGLATLGINYYNLGYLTGQMAVEVMEGEAETATMPIGSLKEFDYVINGAVAQEIGLTIPSDMTQYIVEGK